MIKDALQNVKALLKKEKERFSLGLDIGTEAIKTVKLKFVKDAMELCAFNLEPVQSNLTDALNKIKQSENEIELVNVGVSGPATVTRYVNFPRMNEMEMRQALKFEAQKHIPFSIAEMNLDGYILKEGLPDNKILVLIAAVKKELISQRLKLIEESGFKINVVDIDSLALVNAFNANNPSSDNLKHKAIALLNIGATITNLDILENGSPRLSRDIHIAGNNFTQRIADVFSMDFQAAEGLKISPPDAEKAKSITTAIEPVINNLSAEIRTSFDYYESQSTTSVAKIFLSGGASQFVGLKDTLANLLGIEVELWDPLKNIILSSSIDAQKLKSCSAQLAVAVGLALRQ